MIMATARTSHDWLSACAAPLALVPEHKPLDIVNALAAKGIPSSFLPLLTPKISARRRGVGRPIPLISRELVYRCVPPLPLSRLDELQTQSKRLQYFDRKGDVNLRVLRLPLLEVLSVRNWKKDNGR